MRMIAKEEYNNIINTAKVSRYDKDLRGSENLIKIKNFIVKKMDKEY